MRARKEILAFDRSGSVRSFDSDGHLHVESANISKATVNPYYGREIPGGGKDLVADKVYQLLRDPAELQKAAASFAGKPILITHTPVSADDHPHEKVIGSIGTDVQFDAPYLTAPLTIWDGDAIQLIESGKQRALSCGYRYAVDWEPGTFEGVHYDGKMRDIEANHLALVVEGRAGPDVIVGDSKPNAETIVMNKRAKVALDADPADPKDDPEAAKNPDADKDKAAAADAEAGEEDDSSEAIEAAYEQGYADGMADGNEMTGKDRAARDKRVADRKAARDKGKTAKDAGAECDKPKAKDADPDKDETDKPKEKEGEKDKKAQDQMISQQAMDAAVVSAAKLAEKTITTRMKEAREAERFVRPWVGELAVAYDTGEEILRASAVALGVPDAATIHASALKAMIGMMPKPGERSNVTRLAADSGARAAAATDEFTKMFPTAVRPRTL